MANHQLNSVGLRYNSFSVVYMQIFGLNKCNPQLFKKPILEVNDEEPLRKTRKDIDKQIFVIGEEGSPVRRFNLPDFQVSIFLDSETHPYPARISGTVKVEMSLFFDKTVVLTFSLMVNGAVCSSSDPLTTDHLISLVALNLGGEHWSSSAENEKTASNINLKNSLVEIDGLELDEEGNWLTRSCSLRVENFSEEGEEQVNLFARVCSRYRSAILKQQPGIPSRHQDFVYIDVWEDVDNYDGSLARMEKEEDIISYIEENCKKEMVGLMTLYPKEWPYRTEESFYEVCGRNIAIDTDDLILLNANMCAVFGTYGRRAKGSLTDWKEHLELRKTYCVSWPEYMLILEMVLAKKYTISAARDFLLRSAKTGEEPHLARKSIEANSTVELTITQLLLKLDAVNYSKFMSHKIMFDRTLKRLEVERDESNLKEVMAKVENALSNLSKVRSLKQAERFNYILGGISIASLFQVILTEVEVPFLIHAGGASWAKHLGMGLVSFAMAMVVIGLIYLLYLFVQNKGAVARLWIRDRLEKKNIY